VIRRLALASLLSIAVPGAAASASGDSLSARVEAVMNRQEFRHSFWGVEFRDLASGRVVYSHNPDKLFVPGSTTKLVTAGAALMRLGPEHRFRTAVYAAGDVEAGGVLKGDLVLVASGDPNLSNRLQADGTLAFRDEDHSYGGPALPGDPLAVLRGLSAQVAGRGIRRITGHVLVDATMFPEGEREGGTGVVISPIVVNDNVVDLELSPGPSAEAPTRLVASPATGYVRFTNQVKTGAAGSAPDVSFASDVVGSDGSRDVVVSGTVPVDEPAQTLAYAVPEPTRFAELAFCAALRAAGIAAEPRPVSTRPDFAALAGHYTDAHRLAEHLSAPLAEEVKVILKVSQNLHASALPFVLGALSAKPGTAQAGFDRMREALREKGLDLEGASQGDGAGAAAHFTPAFMVRFLTLVSKQPGFQAFFDGLPILGRDGTLAAIQKEAAAAGHVHAKTGTYVEGDLLNRALHLNGKGLAGYVDTKAGRRLAFAVFLNHVPLPSEGEAVTKIAGQALGEIAAAAYDAE